MKKIFIGILIGMALIFVIWSWVDRDSGSSLNESSALIQNRIDNVSKLVVSEGHFAEVFNFKDSKELFGSFYTAEKKALIVVNAEARVSYDLSQVGFHLDPEKKTLFITNIPEPEINIDPKLEYYDISSDFLNPFQADDHNKIDNKVRNILRTKINNSKLVSNAQNRLVTELSQFLLLTKTLGWKLVYNEQQVESFENLDIFTENGMQEI